MNLEKLLADRRVCVVAGSGGVGKTTTAAALAVAMAERGRRVVVLTIDPARRLADALGIEALGNVPQAVPLGKGAELWAMMLDPRRTFDDLIDTYAPDTRTRDAILANRIYQEISSAVAGSQEYMAMEKLYELSTDASWDLIILDTPPTRNALDFLDSPARLHRFLDSRALQLFMKPSLVGIGLLGKGGGMLFSVLKRITGIDLLQDLSDFFALFANMTGGFSDRAKQVQELLFHNQSTFLVVASPQDDALDEALFFRARLYEKDMPFGGMIINRVHPGHTIQDRPGMEKELKSLLGAEFAQEALETFAPLQERARRDRRQILALQHAIEADTGITTRKQPILRIPYLASEVHDLKGLREMGSYLLDD